MAGYTHVGPGLPPLHGARANALILGSFPSPKSREQGFFYGHKQNRFWPMIAAVTGEPVPDWADIEAKKAILRNHGLAVWDTIGACRYQRRVGCVHPQRGSQRCSCADTQAGRAGGVLQRRGVGARLCENIAEPLTHLPATVLPSTSPANAAWSAARLQATSGRSIGTIFAANRLQVNGFCSIIGIYYIGGTVA